MWYTNPDGMKLAIDVAHAMASQRGHVLTEAEIEQTLLQVRDPDPVKRFLMAWGLLLPSEQVTEVPALFMQEDRFPAWSFNSLGFPQFHLTAPRSPSSIESFWVVHQAADFQDSMAEEKPASTAIRTALLTYKPVFVKAGVVTVFVNLLSVLTSLFAMQVYDRVVPNFAMSTLWVLTLGIALAIALEWALKNLRHSFVEGITENVDKALSQFFFDQTLSLKLDKRPSKIGSMVAQVRDYEQVKSFFTSTTLFVIADLPFTLFFVAIIAMLGGVVALVPLLFIPLSVGVGLLAKKPFSRMQEVQDDESARRHGVLIEALQSAELVKAQGLEWRFSLVWQALTEKLAKNAKNIRSLSSHTQYIVQSLQQLAYVLVVVAGVYAIQAGNLTIGGLIACSILAGRVLGNIGQVASVLVQWHQTQHALYVLNKMLTKPSDEDGRRVASTSSRVLDYSVESIVYCYEESREPQFQCKELTIKSGSRIAVIGKNGSGKSTLLRLLAGVSTPTAGRVSLGGLDLQTVRLGWLRRNVGYLPQEVRLFAGSLRDNLTFGITITSEAQLPEALLATGLDRLIKKHPLGLDMPIREGGMGLSGGQRQLVALTRLMLLKPLVWILDEPSSSLDRESEFRVMATIRNLPPECTLIITTHQHHWLDLVSRVLIVEDGSLRRDTTPTVIRQALNESRAATNQQNSNVSSLARGSGSGA